MSASVIRLFILEGALRDEMFFIVLGSFTQRYVKRHGPAQKALKSAVYAGFSFPDLNLRFQDDVWRWNADRITADFDEFQRELIVENTRAGLAATRMRGRRGGRALVLDKE